MEIKKEIEAYESMREKLELESMGKWALIHDGELINIYESFEATAEDAVSKFGGGPYLIRQIGASSTTLPASVMYKTSHD